MTGSGKSLLGVVDLPRYLVKSIRIGEWNGETRNWSMEVALDPA